MNDSEIISTIDDILNQKLRDTKGLQQVAIVRREEEFVKQLGNNIKIIEECKEWLHRKPGLKIQDK